MSEIAKQRIAMMVNNTVRIIVFAVLAILFNHWWIVLMSACFIVYEEDEKEEVKNERN